MQRMQLTWSRNQDDNTKSYRVIRAVHPNVTRKDMVIMEVEHSIVPKPIKIEYDKLVKTEEGYYQSTYKNIMPDPDQYPAIVLLNGVNAESLGVEVTVMYEEGVFLFGTAFNDSDELLATYYIDGIRVLDTDEIKQEGVHYFGPVARDRSENSIPENVVLVPEPNNGRLVLRWNESFTLGQQRNYRVEALDAYGNFSQLSLEAFGFLKEGLSNESYLVERSFDGENWHIVSRQGANEYLEYGVDRDAPNAVNNLATSVAVNYDKSNANVTLKWDKATAGLPSASGMFRVRSISAMGTLSPASAVVGPVYLLSKVDRIVVRRKTYDGTFPTYNGEDAITVGILTSDGTELVDEKLADHTSYAYAVYCVDRAGNISIAATTIVEIGDATPPPQITGVTVATHSYII